MKRYLVKRKISIIFEQDIQTALNIVNKNKGFKLFKENFEKNKNSFPYTKPSDIKIGTITLGYNPIGIIAYAYPQALKKYRNNKKDGFLNYAHMFDIEILNTYRKRGFGSRLIEGVCQVLKRNQVKGVTLMAKNQDLANYYKNKYNFKFYKDEETEESPMMYKIL